MIAAFYLIRFSKRTEEINRQKLKKVFLVAENFWKTTRDVILIDLIKNNRKLNKKYQRGFEKISFIIKATKISYKKSFLNILIISKEDQYILSLLTNYFKVNKKFILPKICGYYSLDPKTLDIYFEPKSEIILKGKMLKFNVGLIVLTLLFYESIYNNKKVSFDNIYDYHITKKNTIIFSNYFKKFLLLKSFESLLEFNTKKILKVVPDWKRSGKDNKFCFLNKKNNSINFLQKIDNDILKRCELLKLVLDMFVLKEKRVGFSKIKFHSQNKAKYSKEVINSKSEAFNFLKKIIESTTKTNSNEIIKNINIKETLEEEENMQNLLRKNLEKASKNEILRGLYKLHFLFVNKTKNIKNSFFLQILLKNRNTNRFIKAIQNLENLFEQKTNIQSLSFFILLKKNMESRHPEENFNFEENTDEFCQILDYFCKSRLQLAYSAIKSYVMEFEVLEVKELTESQMRNQLLSSQNLSFTQK